MTQAPKRISAAALQPLGLEATLARATELIERRLASSTRKAYAADLRAFERWAQLTGLSPDLPVGVPVCAAWLTASEMLGCSLSTIRRRATGLAHAHREAGLDSPTAHQRIRELLSGIAKARADAGERPNKKRPLSPSMVRAALEGLGCARDRAVVLVALVTGLRRSELAALKWGDLEPSGEGMLVWLRRSKTDQVGAGRPMSLPRGRGDTCPVRAITTLRGFRERGGRGGKLDRVFGCSAKTIARIIKRAAELAGEDPSSFGAHSARAGLLTSASASGVDLAAIMRQSGHASTSIALGYIRPAEQDRNPAAKAVVDRLGEA